jgi:L-rhamnose 1-dehydrogenase
LTSVLEFVKHGAPALILHYFGDEATEAEIQSLQREVETIASHVRVVVVAGDIADPATSAKVCIRSASAVRMYII